MTNTFGTGTNANNLAEGSFLWQRYGNMVTVTISFKVGPVDINGAGIVIATGLPRAYRTGQQGVVSTGINSSTIAVTENGDVRTWYLSSLVKNGTYRGSISYICESNL